MEDTHKVLLYECIKVPLGMEVGLSLGGKEYGTSVEYVYVCGLVVCSR